MHRYLKLLLVALLAIAVVVPADLARGGDDETVSIDEDTEQFAFRRVNNARSKKDLRKLDLNGVIRREARRHSEDMAEDEEVSTNGLGDNIERILRDDNGIDDAAKICAVVTRVSETGSDAPRQVFRRFQEDRDARRCMFDRDGYSTQSGAFGVAEFNSRSYVTFIAAHDTT
jgi:uncharacterized protein YkwD